MNTCYYKSTNLNTITELHYLWVRVNLFCKLSCEIESIPTISANFRRPKMCHFSFCPPFSSSFNVTFLFEQSYIIAIRCPDRGHLLNLRAFHAIEMVGYAYHFKFGTDPNFVQFSFASSFPWLKRSIHIRFTCLTQRRPITFFGHTFHIIRTHKMLKITENRKPKTGPKWIVIHTRDIEWLKINGNDLVLYCHERDQDVSNA